MQVPAAMQPIAVSPSRLNKAGIAVGEINSSRAADRRRATQPNDNTPPPVQPVRPAASELPSSSLMNALQQTLRDFLAKNTASSNTPASDIKVPAPVDALPASLLSIGLDAPDPGIRHTLPRDLGKFLYALFQDMNRLDPQGNPRRLAAESMSFNDRLSAVITEVANGQVPPALQEAFHTLVVNQSRGSPGQVDTKPPTLQNFLSTLQSNLASNSAASAPGASGSSTRGNLLSARA